MGNGSSGSRQEGGSPLSNACENADESFGDRPVGGVAEPCNEDICQKLRKEIDAYINRNKREFDNKGIHGLVHRFRELLSNMDKQLLGQAPLNMQSWEEHRDQIRGTQNRLQNKLNDYKEQGCGDPPSGAWSWASRPVPTFEDRRKELNLPDGTSSFVTTGAKAGAAVVTGGVVLYGLYRVVRFLPSLAPPLWWSIPGNLAIP